MSSAFLVFLKGVTCAVKNFIKSFFGRAVGVVVLILIGVMIYSATTGGFATLPETVAGAVVTPFQTFVTKASDKISGFFSDLTGSGHLRTELEALKKENADLRQKLADYDELRQQNAWYNEILGLHEEHTDYTFASGRVIGRDPSDYYGNFVISSGTNAGISAKDPVVTTNGVLVGIVEEVGLTYARVRTVMDPASKVSAQISRTGDTGYTAGSKVEQARRNTIRMTALERSSGTAIGDYVVSSGIGGVYPSGLLIGTVRAVTGESDGVTLSAEVELFAEIYNLKQVMVITSFDGQLTE